MLSPAYSVSFERVRGCCLLDYVVPLLAVLVVCSLVRLLSTDRHGHSRHFGRPSVSRTDSQHPLLCTFSNTVMSTTSSRKCIDESAHDPRKVPGGTYLPLSELQLPPSSIVREPTNYGCRMISDLFIYISIHYLNSTLVKASPPSDASAGFHPFTTSPRFSICDSQLRILFFSTPPVPCP